MASFASPVAIAIDASGNVYTANQNHSTVSKITPAGVVTESWAALVFNASPSAIAIDASGNVYTANENLSTVSKITPAGVVTESWAALASFASPVAIAIDASGNVYTANQNHSTVSKITPAGVVTESWAALVFNASPSAIAIDASGNVYTANENISTVSKITPAGVVTPSVSIAANPSGSITTGTSVTFTATPTNGGTTPAYQWKKNGSDVGTNSATYTDAALANNDVISCVMTSNDPCASPTTATSNEITMSVTVVEQQPLPMFTGLNSSYCDLDASVTLTGNLAPDGYFVGPGITDNGDGTATFDPSDAVGTGTVRYLYSTTNFGAPWASISTKGYHNLAIKTDGTLWAWGGNEYGQFGNGTNTDSDIPVQVGTGTDWASVSAGAYHSLALKTDGTLWAWGYNSNGELGNGTIHK